MVNSRNNHVAPNIFNNPKTSIALTLNNHFKIIRMMIKTIETRIIVTIAIPGLIVGRALAKHLTKKSSPQD